jgi:hypothetical protein
VLVPAAGFGMAAGFLDEFCRVGEADQHTHDDDQHHAANPFGRGELPAHQ